MTPARGALLPGGGAPEAERRSGGARARPRGIALVVAMAALAVVGSLVAGLVFVALQDQRVGQNAVRQQQALDAAEAGAQAVVLGWDQNELGRLPVGASAVARGVTPTGWYRRAVERLSPSVYLVRSEGFSWDSAVRQHTGLLIRVRPLPGLLKQSTAPDSAMLALLSGPLALPLKERSWVALY